MINVIDFVDVSDFDFRLPKPNPLATPTPEPPANPSPIENPPDLSVVTVACRS
jgi:hypothetical protein